MPFTSASERVLVHILSYGNELDLQDNERASKPHFSKIVIYKAEK